MCVTCFKLQQLPRVNTWPCEATARESMHTMYIIFQRQQLSYAVYALASNMVAALQITGQL
jgi:hypothetical protein